MQQRYRLPSDGCSWKGGHPELLSFPSSLVEKPLHMYDTKGLPHISSMMFPSSFLPSLHHRDHVIMVPFSFPAPISSPFRPPSSLEIGRILVLHFVQHRLSPCLPNMM